jgi:hypothetical protein
MTQKPSETSQPSSSDGNPTELPPSAMKLIFLSSPDGNVAWQGNSLAHSIATAGLLRRFFSTFE